MNTLIGKLITFDNQIIVVGEPQRTGLQAIIAPGNKINPTDKSDSILIQLVTADGYEVDYTAVMLVDPDFS